MEDEDATVSITDLPDGLQRTVRALAPKPRLVVVKKSRGLMMDHEELDEDGWIVYALSETRLTTTFFTPVKDGSTRETTQSYPLSAIGQVEIDGRGGRIHVQSDEGEFSTGVPAEVAQAIIGQS